MSNLQLYKLVDQWLELQEFLADTDNELDEQTIADTLEGMEGALDEKLLSMAAMVRNMEGLLNQLGYTRSVFEIREKQLERRIERIKRYMLLNMERAGKRHLEGDGEHAPDLKVVNNQPSISDDLDIEALPGEYKRLTLQCTMEEYEQLQNAMPMMFAGVLQLKSIVPMKKELLKILKTGEQIPGAQMIRRKRLDIS